MITNWQRYESALRAFVELENDNDRIHLLHRNQSSPHLADS